MKKNIKICDICNERVASNTCEICKKDICGFCGKSYDICIKSVNRANQNMYGGFSGVIGSSINPPISTKNLVVITMCKECFDTQYDEETLGNMKKDIVGDMIKGKIIKNLGG